MKRGTLSWMRRGDQHDAVEALAAIRCAGVGGGEDQRGLDDDNGVRLRFRESAISRACSAITAGCTMALSSSTRGVARRRPAARVRGGRASRPGAPRRGRMRDDGGVNRLAGLHHRAAHLVGREDDRSALGEHLRDGGLAAAEVARKPYTQHRATLSAGACATRARAVTVFFISMAMVSAPTPPGTGVYAPRDRERRRIEYRRPRWSRASRRSRGGRDAR